MSEDDDPVNPTISVTDSLPPAFQRVIAISPEFKCMGYIDDKNIWRHDSDNAEIKDVFAWKECP